MSPFRAYVICTSPRSGSTLLCRLLEAAGAGHPDSHFHRPSIDAWLSTYGLGPAATPRGTVAAIVEAAIRRGTGQTGVFGLRLQRHSFAFFMQQLDLLHPGLPSDRARIEAAFGPTLFLHLTRSDKLAQAISLVKAQQSGLWHLAPDGTEIERTAPPQEPVYDRAAIAAAMDELAGLDRDWLDWFAAEAITPHRIRYDDLAADPGTALAGILARLGRDPAVAQGIAPPVARLSDDTSRAWAARFGAGD